MNIGLFGRGRLATAIRERAADSIAWQVGREDPPVTPVEVAIEASTGAAVASRVGWALERGVALVIASTGWEAADLGRRVGTRIGVVIAPNLSLAAALLRQFSSVLGRFCDADEQRDPYVVEHHHARKRDAPSGTAILLAETIVETCGRKTRWCVPPLDRPLEPQELSVSAVRAGTTASTHIVGVDTPGEAIEVRHTARDLSPYAEGALAAARWIRGRQGVHHFDQMASEAIAHVFEETRP